MKASGYRQSWGQKRKSVPTFGRFLAREFDWESGQYVGEPKVRADMIVCALNTSWDADDSTAQFDERLARAGAILARWDVTGILARDVILAVDRLNGQLREMWPEARIRREVPVYARFGDQLVTGRVDALAEDEEGFAVVDHKSFPGSRDLWESRAVTDGPQLGIYARALTVATGRPWRRLYLHMPIVGMLVRLALGPKSANSAGPT